MTIRRLTENDVEAFLILRREALSSSPLAFASSPEQDRASDADALHEQLRAAGEAVIFGSFDDNTLEGSVGLYRDPHRKASHKLHLWGMYVTPARRGRGVGSRLLTAALQYAGSLDGVAWVHLGVSSAAPAARRLYEAAGFQAWGTEPDSLRDGGQSVSELHMALRLD